YSRQCGQGSYLAILPFATTQQRWTVVSHKPQRPGLTFLRGCNVPLNRLYCRFLSATRSSDSAQAAYSSSGQMATSKLETKFFLSASVREMRSAHWMKNATRS